MRSAWAMRIALFPIFFLTSAAESGVGGSAADLRDCSDCVPMVRIAPKDGKVYYLAKFETTWSEYARAVREANCAAPRNDLNQPRLSPRGALLDEHPVTGITVDEFACYLGWLSKKSGHRYRLPTPEEWLAAARSASAAPRAWSAEDRVRAAQQSHHDPREAVNMGIVRPVGLGEPSGDGLFDLEGNAAEATSAVQAGSYQAICKKFGRDFCKGVGVLGLQGQVPSNDWKSIQYFLAGQPSRYYGFRVARD